MQKRRVLVGCEGKAKGRQDPVLGDLVRHLASPFEGECADDGVHGGGEDRF
jgi:hypothetical protein